MTYPADPVELRGMNKAVGTPRTGGILGEVAMERQRQDAKWGQQDHEDSLWLGILGKEYGEVSKAVNEINFEALVHGFENTYAEVLDQHAAQTQHLREELIQVAAVAVSWVEAIDRKGLA